MTKTAQEILGGSVEANVDPTLAARTLAAPTDPEPNVDADLREDRELDELAEPDARAEDYIKAGWSPARAVAEVGGGGGGGGGEEPMSSVVSVPDEAISSSIVSVPDGESTSSSVAGY